jgi:hypothetical protein
MFLISVFSFPHNLAYIFVFQRILSISYTSCFENVFSRSIILLYLVILITFREACELLDRLCGLVLRVPGYRSRGPGSIPGATRFSEK